MASGAPHAAGGPAPRGGGGATPRLYADVNSGCTSPSVTCCAWSFRAILQMREAAPTADRAHSHSAAELLRGLYMLQSPEPKYSPTAPTNSYIPVKTAAP